MGAAPPRALEQRKADVLVALTEERDAWVSTAHEDGTPYLVPLCFAWWREQIVLATPETNPTARNLLRSGVLRLAIGRTRDVILVDGIARHYGLPEVPEEMGDAFAAKAWDARLEKIAFGFFAITPREIQAWREANEIPGRTVMRDGKWLI